MNSAQELSTLIAALRALSGESRPHAALATLVRTRGSTFRRAGTRMLVLADGSVVCELSGGCPQRDIVLRAQEVMATGVPLLVRYNTDSGLDVLMEMGCGGELEVLLEPLVAPKAMDFVDALAGCLEARQSARMATLFAIDDAVVIPRRLLWSGESIFYDGFDHDVLTRSVFDAIASADACRAIALRLDSPQGAIDVLIEPVAPPHALIVVGSSAAARALLPVASALGWQTTLVDHDPARLRVTNLPAGLRAVCATPDNVRELVPLDRHSSVVVMTHNLEHDMAYLAALRDAPIAYLGTLGSRERVGRMRGDGQLKGIKLHAPAGLDIGSETPEEIALAVAAEIMAVINGRSGGPLRDNEGAIH
jgi:xanthine dehydrogenase accessory factor